MSKAITRCFVRLLFVKLFRLFSRIFLSFIFRYPIHGSSFSFSFFLIFFLYSFISIFLKVSFGSIVEFPQSLFVLIYFEALLWRIFKARAVIN